MKKTETLTRLLDFMEENIDIGHIREIEQLQYDAINYKKIDRLPLTICTVVEGFEQIPLEEAYNDPEKMLYNEILWSSVHSSYNSVRLKDDGPLMIRPDFGAGIIASMFGCRTSMYAGQMPWVEPLTPDEVKKTFSKGVPDVKSALGKRVIETLNYYHERLKSFPKCYEAIHITQPDMQGPFDIIHLILGNPALLLPYDNPGLLRYMLEIVSSTYVQFRREVDPLLTDRIGDAVFVHGYCCGGKVLIKADTSAANLSEKMYELYEKATEAFILDAFKNQGGGSLSFCGGPLPWHNEAVHNKFLRCINYGSPELRDLGSNYTFMKKKDTAIVGWGHTLGYDEVKKAVEKADHGKPAATGITLMCKAKSVQEGRDILKRHKKLQGSF